MCSYYYYCNNELSYPEIEVAWSEVRFEWSEARSQHLQVCMHRSIVHSIRRKLTYHIAIHIYHNTLRSHKTQQVCNEVHTTIYYNL